MRTSVPSTASQSLSALIEHGALDGLVALITGASRGIGRAIAAALAAEGMRLALCGRDSDRLAETASMAAGIRECDTRRIEADLRDPEAPKQIVARVLDCYGGLDVLINNAGITLNASVEVTTAAEWDEIMAVNARAPFLLCKESLGLLRRSERPSIINISSVVGRKGYERQGAYAASKHALVGFTKVLAQEVHDDDIRVHIIAPGGVDTDMIRSVRPDIEPEYLMSPDDVAQAVVFLLRNRGNMAIDEINLRRAKSSPFQ